MSDGKPFWLPSKGKFNFEVELLNVWFFWLLWGGGRRYGSDGTTGRMLNIWRYLKPKPVLRLLPTVWLCCRIFLSFIVACCVAFQKGWRCGGVGRAGYEVSVGERLPTIVVCELSFIVVYFSGQIFVLACFSTVVYWWLLSAGWFCCLPWRTCTVSG